MTPRAQIVHQVTGRVRMVVKSRRRNEEYFESVREQLSALEGVEGVKVNQVTGSVTVSHPDTPYSEIVTGLGSTGLFEIGGTEEEAVNLLTPFRAKVGRIDHAIARGTWGVLNLRTLTLAGAVGFSIRQYKRGKILGPAVMMVWTAADMLVHLVPDKTTED
ncbi:MAG: heavy-metal-associated domain-containing protein [Gammaproteobacteria bacterium]|nr:heavy-metal-associated domain-containing protein [Gammaproteobacteria bacterium]